MSKSTAVHVSTRLHAHMGVHASTVAEEVDEDEEDEEHEPIAKLVEDVDIPQYLDDYLVLGVSVCFRKEKGKGLVEARQIEPIAPQSLECMTFNAPTSFVQVTAVTLGDALAYLHGTKEIPDCLKEGELCEYFQYKAEAAARCWKRPYPEEMLMGLVPLGSVKKYGKFDVENYPRVLNVERVVTDSDNVKQDLSIDVYGRTEDGEEVEEDAHIRNGAKRTDDGENPVVAASSKSKKVKKEEGKEDDEGDDNDNDDDDDIIGLLQ